MVLFNLILVITLELILLLMTLIVISSGFYGNVSESGLVRLDHPVGSVANPAEESGKENKKELPGQPSSYNTNQLIKSTNLPNQNLVNQSGILSSQASSSVTTSASAFGSSPQHPPSSSGTNSTLSANLNKNTPVKLTSFPPGESLKLLLSDFDSTELILN